MSDDTYGLRSLDLETLRRKRGAKWQYQPAPFCAWVADMDFPVAPAITEAIDAISGADEYGYPAWRQLSSPAAQAFARRMDQRFGWEVRPDRLHELNDVMQGVQVALHRLSAPGDGVVLHVPAYHPFLSTLESQGRRLVPIEYHDGLFDYDDLERRLSDESARVLLLCHPHNPLGHVFDRVELERIADIAARHDLRVISDEIHADLTYADVACGAPTHIPFESLGADVSARTVTVTSASKAFNIAGLRWAILHAGDDDLHDVLRALPGHYLGTPSNTAVAATVAAWAEGDGWFREVLTVLDENRHALSGLLARLMPSARYNPPEATYLAWVDVSALDLGSNPERTFRELGVAISPGWQFGESGIGYVRINFATSPAILAETVKVMAG